ncbi:alpha/beta fold hydrolase [Amycolatopsis decaplanina]|uniref:AB hydrolase-1 domain-containing protein n=1 Tax=Amycolatopsis decaplanina DSM 44594 TaxID=1284240 RepID=M2YQS8_9PSEU|nr:alpha/beta hydrolase [Amycolatopsis decaplanina]EME64340.1 hypothetical protein H074_03200 [Amycolatopsis decaplanina DSM 44594]
MIPIVFVHGIRLSGAAWTEQLARSAHPAKAVDLPGHGARRGERFTLAAAADAVAAVIDEPALVVGHSLGGYVAIAAAARYPERVAGLVVAGSTFLPGKTLEAPFRVAHRLLMRLPDQGERLSRWQFQSVLPPELAEAVIGGGIATEVIPDVAKAFADFDVLAELAAYPGPTWLINGSRDHFRRHERRFLDACADGRLISVPRAGHYLPMARGREFAQLVLDAARSLPISTRHGTPWGCACRRNRNPLEVDIGKVDDGPMVQKSDTATESYSQAQIHLKTWLKAVDTQWGRITRAAEEDVRSYRFEEFVSLDVVLQLRADAMLFSFALNQLRSTVGLLGSYMPEELAAEVDQAVAEFDSKQPWVKEARNILAHFDEYIRGMGRRQRASIDGCLEIRSRTSLPTREDSRVNVADYALTIEIAPGLEPIEVNVHKSTGDAIEMTRTVEETCRKFNGRLSC